MMVDRQVIYVLGVGVRVVEPVRPVDDTLRLLPEEMVVGSLVNLGDLVTTVDDGLDGPVAVLNVIDLDSSRGDVCEQGSPVRNMTLPPPTFNCLQLLREGWGLSPIHVGMLIGPAL